MSLSALGEHTDHPETAPTPTAAGDCYTVDSGVNTVDGAAIRPGYYVPIDYEVVGGTSSAVERGWVLRALHTPEKNCGTVM